MANRSNNQFFWPKLSTIMLFVFFILALSVFTTLKFGVKTYTVAILITMFSGVFSWGFNAFGYNQKLWDYWTSLNNTFHIVICILTAPWLFFLAKPLLKGIAADFNKKD